MNKRHWQDAVNLLVGTCVYFSPWLVKHSMVTETPGGGILGIWDLWTVGLLVFSLQRKQWARKKNLVAFQTCLHTPCGYNKSHGREEPQQSFFTQAELRRRAPRGRG